MKYFSHDQQDLRNIKMTVVSAEKKNYILQWRRYFQVIADDVFEDPPRRDRWKPQVITRLQWKLLSFCFCSERSNCGFNSSKMTV
jgi:hypothetical protein